MSIRNIAEAFVYGAIGDYEPQPRMPESQRAVLYNHEILRKSLTAAAIAFPFAYRFIPGIRELPEMPVYIFSAATYGFFRAAGTECICGANKMRKRDRKKTCHEDKD